MQNAKLQFKIQNFLTPLSIIGLAIILRLVPHPPNVAPIAAMALFGGCYLNKRYALFVPLITMVVSDFFIGFHSTMPFVYGSFVITGLIGMWLKRYKTPATIIGASLFSSLLFFIITNFGVWFVGTMYPKTIDGFLQSYAMAIPFFQNTIIGDLLYTGLFFGSFTVINNTFFVTKTVYMQSKAPKSV